MGWRRIEVVTKVTGSSMIHSTKEKEKNLKAKSQKSLKIENRLRMNISLFLSTSHLVSTEVELELGVWLLGQLYNLRQIISVCGLTRATIVGKLLHVTVPQFPHA